ncbi:MAG: hypothetical protein ACREQJ_07290 [Candidatus Binatia bacterium]
MTADTFRRDRFLRASGYNFYVWGVVNILVTAPLLAALSGHRWPGWAEALFPIGLIVAGIALAALNENRVEKLVGPPAEVPVVDAARLWAPLFLLAIGFTAIFLVRGPAAYVQPLWMGVIGAGYLAWGSFTIGEFRRLGALLVAAAIVSGLAIDPGALPPGGASPFALGVWIVVTGVLWLPFGAYVNRKYVHDAAP